MAAGDVAAAAGMNIYDGNENANELWVRDNEVLDEVAKDRTATRSVARGGTGATEAGAARANLGAAATVHTHIISQVYSFDGVTPYAQVLQSIFDSMQAQINAKVSAGVDVTFNNVWLASSYPASSGYSVAYINSDGRISRGASSRRFKKYIHDAPDLGDLFEPRLTEFQMRSDGVAPADPTWRIGNIAEELIGTAAERFLVRDENGDPFSIDFIALDTARTYQLRAELDAARDEIAELRKMVTDLAAKIEGSDA